MAFHYELAFIDSGLYCLTFMHAVERAVLDRLADISIVRQFRYSLNPYRCVHRIKRAGDITTPGYSLVC